MFFKKWLKSMAQEVAYEALENCKYELKVESQSTLQEYKKVIREMREATIIMSRIQEDFAQLRRFFAIKEYAERIEDKKFQDRLENVLK